MDLVPLACEDGVEVDRCMLVLILLNGIITKGIIFLHILPFPYSLLKENVVMVFEGSFPW